VSPNKKTSPVLVSGAITVAENAIVVPEGVYSVDWVRLKFNESARAAIENTRPIAAIAGRASFEMLRIILS
jgi:hypothetical protein